MNKKIIILLIIIGIVILIGISTTKKTLYYQLPGYSVYDNQIIYDYEQYLSFIDSHNETYGNTNNFNPNKYNQEYFETKSIAILNVIIGSSANKLRNIEISVNNNKLICNVDIKKAYGYVPQDYICKTILVEINKPITEITEFEINY